MATADVKRVFSVQEERQLQYQALRKIQDQYGARQCSLEYYTQSMSRITSAFQSLSQEVIRLIGTFREANLVEAASILQQVQEQEREKLELTVKWQVVIEKERVAEKQDSESPQDNVSSEGHERDQLRKRLAAVEGAIAELLVDFKFECEPILTQLLSDNT